MKIPYVNVFSETQDLKSQTSIFTRRKPFIMLQAL
jgi:hypothetical protein